MEELTPTRVDAHSPAVVTVEHRPATQKNIKCVVWDLDDTLWDGVLLEDQHVLLREEIVHIIKVLDARGILQSVASKNNHAEALAKLRDFALDEYFLYPQINWNSKASSLKTIAESLNIGLDTFAFIDDQQFEREEVNFHLPEVLCVDPLKLEGLLDRPELNPRFTTDDSKRRRLMYLSDIQRNAAEKEFVGPSEEFLATLDMVLTIAPAREEDLQRAEELTVRTHQLNTTGVTYSYDELDYFRRSTKYKLLTASLEDKFGSYGRIGLALLECGAEVWTIKLLLMSCRVMHRGVGTILLNYIMNMASARGVCLRADFIPNNVNRMMYVTYKFAGFREIEKKDDAVVLESSVATIQPYPAYVQVNIPD